MSGAFRQSLRQVLTEHRLPGTLTNRPWACLHHRLRLRRNWRRSRIPGMTRACVVRLPVLRGRYTAILVQWLSLTYEHVALIWNPSLSALAAMFAEGRSLLYREDLLFFPDLEAASHYLDFSQSDLVTEINHDSVDNVRFRHHIVVDPDLSTVAPEPGSWLLPYTAHPLNLGKRRPRNADASRPLKVLFSGVGAFYRDHSLVRREYGIPSRDETLDHLKITLPEATWCGNETTRRRLWQSIRADRPVDILINSVKGRSRDWYEELSHARFFLCLPGSHMPMCHNAIESMACGTIPILAYDDWFAPALRHNEEALCYRDLNELPDLIRLAVEMQPDRVARMRASVSAYYNTYLEMGHVASKLRAVIEAGEVTHLYLNHEDCLTLSRAGPSSVLKRGGRLQRARS